MYKRAGRPGGKHAIETVCAFGCFRLRVVLYKSAFKGPQLEARASPVHTRPLFYEPHRSSGAGRSPCLQRSHLLPPSPPRRRLGPALKACARETYLLCQVPRQRRRSSHLLVITVVPVRFSFALAARDRRRAGDRPGTALEALSAEPSESASAVSASEDISPYAPAVAVSVTVALAGFAPPLRQPSRCVCLRSAQQCGPSPL